MYSEIVICLKDKVDEVFEKQVNMLRERHHAQVLRMEVEETNDYIKTGPTEVLFISDDEDMLLKAKEAGMATNSPKAMRESYMKAMDTLAFLCR